MAEARRPRRARHVPKRLHEDVDDGDLAKVRSAKRARGFDRAARRGVRVVRRLLAKKAWPRACGANAPPKALVCAAFAPSPSTDHAGRSAPAPARFAAAPRTRRPPRKFQYFRFGFRAKFRPTRFWPWRTMPSHRTQHADPPSLPGARKLPKAAAADSVRRSGSPRLSPLCGRVPEPQNG